MIQKVFDTPEKVAAAFATDFVHWAQKNKPFHVALSGGSTPKILFDILASEFRSQINWNDVHLWWGDERCVPPDHEESNYKMTKDHLLKHIDIPHSNIHRVKGENDHQVEARRYATEIEKLLPVENGLPQFNLIILGMGADGHTASIFPHQIDLINSPNICEVATHPERGQNRITLTGKIINNAKTIAFLVTGASKREKLKAIFNETADARLYPATHIKPVTGNLFWYLDQEAVGE